MFGPKDSIFKTKTVKINHIFTAKYITIQNPSYQILYTYKKKTHSSTFTDPTSSIHIPVPQHSQNSHTQLPSQTFICAS